MDSDNRTLRCSHCRAAGFPSTASRLDLTTCPVPGVNNIRGALRCQPEPNAAEIPQGAYQQSCRGCKVADGGTFLRCTHCSTANGAQLASSFRLEWCPPPGSLDNQNGILTCIGQPNNLDIPVGGYRDSCQGCRRAGDLVECTLCRRADGQQAPASYDVRRCTPPAALDNRNGILICRGVPDTPGVPPGAYRDTCQGCSLDANRGALRCSHCLTADGRQVPASLSLLRCAAPPALENRDGALMCREREGAAPKLPVGPYQQSCHDCKLGAAGLLLSCASCRARDGRGRPASYLVQECAPPGRLHNEDGILACRGGLPPGTYHGSCEGCSVFLEGVLTCSGCRAADGRKVAASYKLERCPSPGALENRDGVLACRGAPSSVGAAAGR